MASLTALLLCITLGPWLIARLRKFQIGQHIREEGPQSHHKKAGVPTMGGLLILVSIIVPTLLWANLRTPAIWVALESKTQDPEKSGRVAAGVCACPWAIGNSAMANAAVLNPTFINPTM